MTAISYNQEISATCVHCGAEQAVDAYLVISSVDRPDLIEFVRTGRYPAFTCKRCGEGSGLDIPMLLHRPEQGGIAGLIAVPSLLMTPDQFREVFDNLVHVLYSNLRVHAGEEPVRIVGFQPLMLPAVLSRDVLADMRIHPGQMQPPVEAPDAYRSLIMNLREAAGLPVPGP